MQPVRDRGRDGRRGARRRRRSCSSTSTPRRPARRSRWAATWPGRVTAVLGTHTHVQTNDASLWDGTAYLTDCGMTGPHDSVIGVRTEIALRRFLTQLPARSEPALGDVRLEGALIECDRRERARHANRDVPAAGVKARAGAASRSRSAAALALASRAAAAGAHERGDRAACGRRPPPLLPVARSQVADAPAPARAARPGARSCASCARPCARGEASDVRVALDRRRDRAARPPELIARLRRRADVRADRARPQRCASEPAALAPTRRRAGRERDRHGRARDVGAGPDRARRRRGRARHGPRRRLPAALDRRRQPGSTPTTQHTTPFDEDARGHGTEVAEVDRLDGAGRARHRRARLQRRRPEHARAPCTASSSGRSIPTATRARTTRRASSTARGTTAGRATARPSSTATSAALRAAGIVPVFAAGNSGSAARAPARARPRRRAPSRSAACRAPTSSRRSRAAGRRRAATPSSRPSRPTARGSRSRARPARPSSRARRSPHRR